MTIELVFLYVKLIFVAEDSAVLFVVLSVSVSPAANGAPRVADHR